MALLGSQLLLLTRALSSDHANPRLFEGRPEGELLGDALEALRRTHELYDTWAALHPGTALRLHTESLFDHAVGLGGGGRGAGGEGRRALSAREPTPCWLRPARPDPQRNATTARSLLTWLGEDPSLPISFTRMPEAL